MRMVRPVSRPYALRFIENRFSLRGTLRIVVLTVVLGGVLNGNSTARAAQVPVVAVSQRPARTVEPLAIGLFVAGAGRTVPRANAIAAIERGTVENAVLGGRPTGKRKIRVAFVVPRYRTPAIIYVVLPPPGRHSNDRRYAVFVVA